MDIAIGFLAALHIIGIVALLGGVLYQMKDIKAGTARIAPGMLHGALTMLVTGLLLVGLNEMNDADVNHMKIGIKLIVLLAVLVLVVAKRKATTVAPAVLGSIGALTTINILLATMW
ncbi:hypothetical protein HT102_04150 [Hoyosella sp. G463]|uniref:Integral membrane protein n=1 Tax=Lolliginicoccus lacisalsi TaxID=2742202 RepID=A0A927JAM6_9ACTN|nr:hypothetical protein [Lolliginicoccus lacisalsi]MBD8505679.1 hypothetical protein [Lolliginicoccus lacisalsi]